MGQNPNQQPGELATVAKIQPLVEYTPYGPNGSLRVPYWKQHLPDSAGTIELQVNLNRPAGSAGALVFFGTGGTAQEGLHYQVNTQNPLRFGPGQTQAAISITLLNSGQYFLERYIKVKLTQGVNTRLYGPEGEAQIWVRPSTTPPILTVGGTFFSVAPGGQVVVPLELSEPCQEPVSIHYSVLSASTLTEYAFVPSGSVVFAPGQTSVNLRLGCSPNAQPGQRLILELRHERKTIRYVIAPLDSNLTTNTHLYSQNIHIDENLWTFSVGGVQQFEESAERNPPPSGPPMPGVPTDSITGGSYHEPGMDDRELIDLLPQTNPVPVVDPFSGIPLKIYSIAEAATQLAPYLRKSFNASFCGSNTQLYNLPEYMRVSYYIQQPQGTDAFRAIPYFRAGVRVRTQDLNHGVTFRIGSTGVDSAGNPVPVVQTSLGPIGVWDRGQVTPQTNLYGVVEDEFGVRVWFCHRLDPTVGFVHAAVGDTRYETPGLDRGNPIEYPSWVSTGDGSLTSMGLSTVDDATGMGNLPYGFMWEISDTDDIFNGDLRPYFPKPGSWWEPQGNAVINGPTALIFLVQ